MLAVDYNILIHVIYRCFVEFFSNIILSPFYAVLEKKITQTPTFSVPLNNAIHEPRQLVLAGNDVIA